MTTINYIRQFLNIVGLTISNFYLDKRNQELKLYVKPQKMVVDARTATEEVKLSEKWT